MTGQTMSKPNEAHGALALEAAPQIAKSLKNPRMVGVRGFWNLIQDGKAENHGKFFSKQNLLDDERPELNPPELMDAIDDYDPETEFLMMITDRSGSTFMRVNFKASVGRFLPITL